MTMPTFKLNRDKYIQLMQSQGISEALTQLHHDTASWEYEAFEGENGYQPQMWEELENVRTFSRELWELALRNETTPVSPVS